MADHYAASCTKPPKVKKDDSRSITPYTRGRNNSIEKRGPNQEVIHTGCSRDFGEKKLLGS